MKKQNNFNNGHAVVVFENTGILQHFKKRLTSLLGGQCLMNLDKILSVQTHRVLEEIEAEKHICFLENAENATLNSVDFTSKNLERNTISEQINQVLALVFKEIPLKTILIGTHCPSITHQILLGVYEKLETADLVIGPARSGSIYLLGMKENHSNIFKNINWHSERLVEDLIEIGNENDLEVRLLNVLINVCDERDLVDQQHLILDI